MTKLTRNIAMLALLDMALLFLGVDMIESGVTQINLTSIIVVLLLAIVPFREAYKIMRQGILARYEAEQYESDLDDYYNEYYAMDENYDEEEMY